MTKDNDRIVYLDGDILSLSDASISPLDRGFLFGDAVYDTFPLYQGQTFGFEAHWARLQHSLQAANIPATLSSDECRKLLSDLFAYNEGENQTIYLQISRGADATRRFRAEHALTPTIFAMSSPLVHQPIDELAQGIRVITTPDLRGDTCHLKSTSLMPSIIMRNIAHAKGMDEAILIKQDHAIEGTISNLMIVIDDALITPPCSQQLLSGTTRHTMLQLAASLSWPVVERSIPKAELYTATEVWLTGTRREISPVIEIDGKTIADGKAGAKWRQMINGYRAHRTEILGV